MEKQVFSLTEQIINIYSVLGSFPGGSDYKSVCLQCGRLAFDPWVGTIPWRRKWQPTPVFLPGEPHGQRTLQATVHGIMTEQLHFHIQF